jgi:WhiB family transcriptional regulator, redox-sensing transcriptional regulator
MTITADHLAEWWSLAACQHADPDLFFPISAAGPARAQLVGAKAVCARCPVRRDCLHYALAADPVQGVWGGLTEEERRLLRQREAKARVRAARRPGPAAPARRSSPAGRRAPRARAQAVAADV